MVGKKYERHNMDVEPIHKFKYMCVCAYVRVRLCVLCSNLKECMLSMSWKGSFLAMQDSKYLIFTSVTRKV